VENGTSSAVLALGRTFVDVLIGELGIICLLFVCDRPLKSSARSLF
jgi:hypothetical protein